ncbi:MAG: ABC transporter permease [Lachnospiraceae bacterium]
MWNAYSAGYIRNNKTGNRFIMIISFLASVMLSLVSGLFYNLWADQAGKTLAESGVSKVEFTPAVIAYIVVFTIASLALIMMIHHAFAATMTNRIHQLGILQSIGATPRQIKSTLVHEVVVLSLPAIIVGNFIGIGLCYAVMTFIIRSTADLRDYTLTFSYHPIVFFGSFGFSMLTAAVSAWIPARKLSRITPLEAIHYGNEPVIKQVKEYRIRTAIFGIYGEIACKSLFVRRKAMRVGTMSIFLAVFSCIFILNMLGVSGLSTERTYFDRYKNNWDFLITVKDDTYSEDLLKDIRNTEDVASCIVHQIVNTNTVVPADDLSADVQKLSLENLNSSFTAGESGAYNTKVPIFILDDKSFAEYRGDTNDANVVAVNIIWDSINSERTDRQYVPFLNEGKEIVLNINGRDVPVSAFADDLPVLREELTQHALTLVMSESYYATLDFNLITEATIYTVKMTDESKNDVVEERLLGLLDAYPDYAFEGRVQELADEMQVQQGLRGIIYLFTVILTCIGLANIFASTLGQIHQRKREFARYFAIGLTPKGAAMILAWEAAIIALRPILLTIVINIPLMAWMLDAGGIAAGDFITKRLPLVPALLLFAAVIVFVALAYYWGGKKICNMNLVEAIKDDTLML